MAPITQNDSESENKSVFIRSSDSEVLNQNTLFGELKESELNCLIVYHIVSKIVYHHKQFMISGRSTIFLQTNSNYDERR